MKTFHFTHSVITLHRSLCRLFCRVYQKNGRFCDLLLVRSLAAVNGGLTGSVDRTSPWQRCVDVDRIQETLGDEHNGFAVYPPGKPKGKKKLGVCKMFVRGWSLKKRVRETDDERKRNKEDEEGQLGLCLCVWVRTLGMMQRWKEEQAFRYRFSFHSYLLLCRNFLLKVLTSFFFF